MNLSRSLGIVKTGLWSERWYWFERYRRRLSKQGKSRLLAEKSSISKSELRKMSGSILQQTEKSNGTPHMTTGHDHISASHLSSLKTTKRIEVSVIPPVITLKGERQPHDASASSAVPPGSKLNTWVQHPTTLIAVDPNHTRQMIRPEVIGQRTHSDLRQKTQNLGIYGHGCRARLLRLQSWFEYVSQLPSPRRLEYSTHDTPSGACSKHLGGQPPHYDGSPQINKIHHMNNWQQALMKKAIEIIIKQARRYNTYKVSESHQP